MSSFPTDVFVSVFNRHPFVGVLQYMFSKISINLHEKICVRAFFLIKLCKFAKRIGSDTDVFLSIFGNFKENFFPRTLSCACLWRRKLSQSRVIVQFYPFSCQNIYGFKVQFLTSKTRLAPLQTLAIPCFELMKCLLLIQNFREVDLTISSELHVERRFCWTDSQVLLHWLSKKRKRENRGLEIGLKLFKKLLIVMNGGMLQV